MQIWRIVTYKKEVIGYTYFGLYASIETARQLFDKLSVAKDYVATIQFMDKDGNFKDYEHRDLGNRPIEDVIIKP